MSSGMCTHQSDTMSWSNQSIHKVFSFINPNTRCINVFIKVTQSVSLHPCLRSERDRSATVLKHKARCQIKDQGAWD